MSMITEPQKQDEATIGQQRHEYVSPEGQKIVTEFIYPPIPDRSFDWCATWDNYDEGSPIGYGATEIDAINDLLMETELR